MSDDRFAIIVIGGSAGALTPLLQMVESLPKDLPAAVFVVIHFPEGQVSKLPDLVARAGELPALHVVDGTPILPGCVYVAPPNGKHMELDHGRVRLVANDKHLRFRPAIDPLFASAARVYGPRVVGILLSGHNRDGVAGLCAIKDAGGTVLVQDPEEAQVPRMPAAGMRSASLDGALSAIDLAGRVVELSRAISRRRARRVAVVD